MKMIVFIRDGEQSAYILPKIISASEILAFTKLYICYQAGVQHIPEALWELYIHYISDNNHQSLILLVNYSGGIGVCRSESRFSLWV